MPETRSCFSAENSFGRRALSRARSIRPPRSACHDRNGRPRSSICRLLRSISARELRSTRSRPASLFFSMSREINAVPCCRHFFKVEATWSLRTAMGTLAAWPAFLARTIRLSSLNNVVPLATTSPFIPASSFRSAIVLPARFPAATARIRPAKPVVEGRVPRLCSSLERRRRRMFIDRSYPVEIPSELRVMPVADRENLPGHRVASQLKSARPFFCSHLSGATTLPLIFSGAAGRMVFPCLLSEILGLVAWNCI